MEEILKLKASELEKIGTEKSPVSDQPNGVVYDSFVVDVEHISHFTNKELTANSKFNLQRSLSRKGPKQRNSETKANIINENNERETKIVVSASPRATLGGASMLEKPIVGPSDRAQAQAQAQAHHQITIKSTGGGADSRIPAKRPSFRRSKPSWAFHPRKIFFFLATLSSMGTILLIYFTLSINKPSGDDSTIQNW